MQELTVTIYSIFAQNLGRARTLLNTTELTSPSARFLEGEKDYIFLLSPILP